jgi:hypothetical protein
VLRESDALPNLEVTSQRGWRIPEVEQQNTTVICDYQAEETRLIEVADRPGECHDRSDAGSGEQKHTGMTPAQVLSRFVGR